MAQIENIYEKFDRLLILSNEIVEEIKTRLAENPNIVEEVENRWLYEIIINLPDDVRIDYLKDKLKKFDDLINTQWKNKQRFPKWKQLKQRLIGSFCGLSTTHKQHIKNI